MFWKESKEEKEKEQRKKQQCRLLANCEIIEKVRQSRRAYRWTREIPRLFLEGATGQGEMLKGATYEIKDLQASWEKLESLPNLSPSLPLLPF